jgi:PKD repeat protein
VEPTAAFTETCTFLVCDFSDASVDSDGSIVSWLWDFGDGSTSTTRNPSHTYSSAGNYTVSLTVTDNEGAGGQTSSDVSPTEPPQFVDYVASGQIAVAGTVLGSFTDTQTNNGVSQAITERVSGGKKQNRYSYLEFKWVFNVGPATGFLLNLNAWASGSTDGDDFVFAWSTNDSTYTDVLTVSSTDPANNQMAILPGTLNGTVYIRVRDTNRVPGNTALDTINVDHLYIHADSAPGTPPDAPSGLAAVAQSASSVALSWTDNSDDELSFEVQVSTDQANWSGAGSPGANATSASVSGLAASTTYYFRVRASNLSGDSAWSNIASATTQDGPPPADIELALSGSKSRGEHVVSLVWSGTTATNVDIFRDGSLLITQADTGAYTDNTQNKGGRTYTYQVCEAGSAECSAVESISF